VEVKEPVFLVTGAADGLGLQLVARLAAGGQRVLATDLDNHRLEEAARLAAWPSDLVRLAPLDVRQPRDWANAFALARRTLGELDVLIHAAAPLRAAEPPAAEPDAGTAQALLAAAEHLLPRSGQVVVIASGEAVHRSVRACCLAADAALRPQGLAVTVVCTGAVETMENGLALRAAPACPALGLRAARVSAECVVDAVLGRVLASHPRQVFLPAYSGFLPRLADLFPALAARLRARGAVGRKPPEARTAAGAADLGATSATPRGTPS
jgi:NAD(P)-dependent dehydrogenase (short-subunit alcohol dehydrogenase family)